MKKIYYLLLLLLAAFTACVPTTQTTLSSLTGTWEPLGFSRGIIEKLEITQNDNLLTGFTYRDDIETGIVSGLVEGNQLSFTLVSSEERIKNYYEFSATINGIMMSGVYKLKDETGKVASNGTFNLSWRGLKR